MIPFGCAVFSAYPIDRRGFVAHIVEGLGSAVFNIHVTGSESQISAETACDGKSDSISLQSGGKTKLLQSTSDLPINDGDVVVLPDGSRWVFAGLPYLTTVVPQPVCFIVTTPYWHTIREQYFEQVSMNVEYFVPVRGYRGVCEAIFSHISDNLTNTDGIHQFIQIASGVIRAFKSKSRLGDLVFHKCEDLLSQSASESFRNSLDMLLISIDHHDFHAMYRHALELFETDLLPRIDVLRRQIQVSF